MTLYKTQSQSGKTHAALAEISKALQELHDDPRAQAFIANLPDTVKNKTGIITCAFLAAAFFDKPDDPRSLKFFNPPILVALYRVKESIAKDAVALVRERAAQWGAPAHHLQ